MTVRMRKILLLLIGMVILATAGMQFYWLERLHRSNNVRNQFWLEKVTFLTATQVNESLYAAQATLTPIDWEPYRFIENFKTRLLAWQKAAPSPELIETIWFVNGKEPGQSFAIDPASGDRKATSWDASGWLHGWLFHDRTTSLPGVPPLVIQEKTNSAGRPNTLVLVMNSDVFYEQFLPECFRMVEGTLQGDMEVTALITPVGHPENRRFVWEMASFSGGPYQQSIHLFPPQLSMSPFSNIDSETLENGPNQLPKTGNYIASAGHFRLCTSLTGGMSQASMRLNQRLQWLVAAGTIMVMLGCFILGLSFLRKTEQLAEQQMAFVAGVSHELRTPIAAIASASDNLAEAVVTDPKRVTTYGHLIREESYRLKTMVDNILGYAKTFSKTRLTGGICDPEGVLDEVITTWINPLKAKNMKLLSHVQSDLPAIGIDADSWRTILANLISNAVKYSPEGTTLAFSLKKSGHKHPHQVSFSIADQGSGIPQSEQSQVFQRFYRGRFARESQIPGSGLGLSLVAQLVKKYEGHIRLKSRQGNGTMFTVTFPASIPESHGQGGMP